MGIEQTVYHINMAKTQLPAFNFEKYMPDTGLPKEM